jgi:hypothetical protein
VLAASGERIAQRMEGAAAGRAGRSETADMMLPSNSIMSRLERSAQ